MIRLKMLCIVAYEEQTTKIFSSINRNRIIYNKGKKKHITSLVNHFMILNEYFDLQNFFEYSHNEILDFQNVVIYHIPNGRDFDTGVEIRLSSLKGKVPIIMRSYDPHSPVKTDTDYMLCYHDLVITYLKQRVNNKDIIFGKMAYDNHLIHSFSYSKRENFACMILRNRTSDMHNIPTKEFIKRGLNLKKNYKNRSIIAGNDLVDIYSTGWDEKQRNVKGGINPFDLKYVVLKRYKFNIILDTAIVESYISEKILDSFLTYTIPIYEGSPDVKKYIPKECYIDINNFNTYDEAINYALNLSPQDYKIYIDNIAAFRLKIFKSFSTFDNYVKPIYFWYCKNYIKNQPIKFKFTDPNHMFSNKKLIVSNYSLFKTKKILKKIIFNFNS